MKVLIIDDEPHIRAMMRMTLEAAGYQVDEGADGEAGLARFGDGREFDVVILDQKMPGLDGLETLRRIKERTPDACVVMATAFASIELAVEAMRLGATDFLRKPMTPETLRGAVGAAIASTASRPPLSRTRAPHRGEIVIQTMNGFQIHPLSDAVPTPSSGHSFRVRHLADGVESTVIVTIDPEAADRIARLTRRRLAPEGAFWRLQAERLLSAYIWTEGRLPADGRLTVRDISREDLDVAAAWNSD